MIDELPQAETLNEILPPSVTSVPSSWPQASSWKFEGFALEITPWICSCCHDKVVHSQLFRMFVRHFPAATDRRMVPASEFVPDHSVIRYERLPKYTQLCAKCVDSESGSKHFRVCSENEFRIAVEQARLLEAQKTKKSNIVQMPMAPAQVAKKLENLL